jgi:F0F1-type ATP synthase assembly protein I
MIGSHAVVRPQEPTESPTGKDGPRVTWGAALRQSAPYLGIGTTLAATVLLGLGVGYWLDQRLKTEPWLFLGCGTFGLLAALYQFFKMVAGQRK